MGLHWCKTGSGWCKRLSGDLCAMGPKHLLHPLLTTFWKFPGIPSSGPLPCLLSREKSNGGFSEGGFQIAFPCNKRFPREENSTFNYLKTPFLEPPHSRFPIKRLLINPLLLRQFWEVALAMPNRESLNGGLANAGLRYLSTIVHDRLRLLSFCDGSAPEEGAQKGN